VQWWVWEYGFSPPRVVRVLVQGGLCVVGGFGCVCSGGGDICALACLVEPVIEILLGMEVVVVLIWVLIWMINLSWDWVGSVHGVWRVMGCLRVR